MTQAGVGSATTKTDALGHYAFAGFVDGSYSVTPSLTGYTFAPGGRSR
jgi:hypothetical protein